MRRIERGRETSARAGGLPDLDVRWAAILDALADGDVERGRALFAPLLNDEPRWESYARLLADIGIAPSARKLVDG